MSVPVYILERLNWRQIRAMWLVLPGTDRIDAFVDRTEAEAEAREREWAVRRRVNPFFCGGPFLHYQTSFDAARLYDWCLDLGLDPPGVTSDSQVWAAWWDFHHRQLTDVQRATMWEALDRVRFFRVREAERGQPGHLVAVPHFEADPVLYEGWGWARYVGCTPYMLTREPATAEHMCDQLYVQRVTREGEYVGQTSRPRSWVLPAQDPLTGPDEDPLALAEGEERTWEAPADPYAEHRPLELLAGRPARPGQDVYVVLRRHWRLEVAEDHTWRWSLTQARSCGRPVAAFDTLAAADDCQARLEAEARQSPSPFRFGPPHEWGTLHPSAIWGVLSELAPIAFTSQWTDYRATDRVWCRWWDEVVPTLTPEQVETAWGLYDRLKFYEIVAVEYRE